MKKIVGNRYIEKRVNLRVEHIRHSNSRQDFLARVKVNAVTSKEAKEKGGESLYILARAHLILYSDGDREDLHEACARSPPRGVHHLHGRQHPPDARARTIRDDDLVGGSASVWDFVLFYSSMYTCIL